MAMFLGHIAFVLELALFGAGLALWHFGREKVAGALRAGALIAMLGAAVSALCTGYYMIRYSVQGDFDHASSFHPGGTQCEMMEGMTKGSGMMGGRRMKEAPERPGESPPAAESPEPPDHEQHHPGEVTK